MTYTEILILAAALAADAMLVCFSYGLIICKNRLKNSLLMSLSFGFFQFIMPLIGWYFTGFFYSKLISYSRWIVFLIFLLLGLKFLKNAFEVKNDEENKECVSLSCIILLSIATSIDAMAAGVTIKFLDVDCIYASVNIGIVTVILSLIGFWTANILKKLPSKPIEITGAVLMIFLAVKSLL